MDWLSALVDWANENEGLLQALAMLGGIGALLISLWNQRAESAVRTQAAEPVPSQVVVRPVAEDRVAGIGSVLSGYGGQVASEGETLTAQFPDADDAARAALSVARALSTEDRSVTEILLCERSAPLPESAAGNRGAVRATGPIRKALLDAADLAVNPGELGGLPFVIETAAPTSPSQVIRRWALPTVGAALVVLGSTWLLFSAEPEPTPIRSIAVLPLENLSGDPKQEPFADAMTDSLIGELAQIRSVRVISRTTMMRYKRSQKSLPRIARELKVDGVIEGSILRHGNRVRISAQLVRAETDEYIWVQQFERPVADLLSLQREIARSVAIGIRSNLGEPVVVSGPISVWGSASTGSSPRREGLYKTSNR